MPVMLNTTTSIRFKTAFHASVVVVLFSLAAMACGTTDESQPWPAQESELLEDLQNQKLEVSPTSIEVAMASIAKQGRNTHPALVGQPSKDVSSLGGWSFAAGGGGAPVGDDTMSPDCAEQPNAAACWGEKLYWSKGCAACHSTDGIKQQPAPSWKGLIGAERTFTSGESLVADEVYIRRSITEPGVEIIQGYGAVMPPMNLNEAQVEAVVEFIKSLK